MKPNRRRINALPRAVLVGAVLAGFIGKPTIALAQPPPATAYAEDALTTAESMYLETRFDDALDLLQGAISRCNEEECDDRVHARLHVLRAEIFVSGLDRAPDAEDELVLALELSPELELHPEVDSKALIALFEQAREATVEDQNVESDEELNDKEESPPEIRRNWIRVAFMVDLALLLGESDVCTAEGQDDRGWFCTRADDSEYRGIPSLGQQNEVGVAPKLATMRAVVGYERVLGDNFTLGVRAGYAFQPIKSGSDEDFLPVHAEARAAYWFGEQPFNDVVRPNLFLAAGLGPVISAAELTIVEDGRACGAVDPVAGDCTVVTDPGQSSPEPRVQRLEANKTAGLGFVSLGFGLSFSPTPVMMIDLGVRVSATFPVFTPLLSPELGMSYGF